MYALVVVYTAYALYKLSDLHYITLHSNNTKTFVEMCDTYDNRHFNNITRNPHHILYQLCLRTCRKLES